MLKRCFTLFNSLLICFLYVFLKKGVFPFTNARLEPEYLTDFMTHDINFPRHRMRFALRKVHDNIEDTILRACVDVWFDIIFD